MGNLTVLKQPQKKRRNTKRKPRKKGNADRCVDWFNDYYQFLRPVGLSRRKGTSCCTANCERFWFRQVCHSTFEILLRSFCLLLLLPVVGNRNPFVARLQLTQRDAPRCGTLVITLTVREERETWESCLTGYAWVL